jgi:serine/threonine protein phosphatase 1
MTGDWKPVLRLEKNNGGRDYVCGDIHGCFDELETELQNLRFDKTCDRLFCVGDIIDRGPKSYLASQYIAQSWFFTILGNHEHMFLMANMDTPESEDYLLDHVKNGGGWAYEMETEKHSELLDAIDSLPLIVKVDNVIIAHANLPAVKSLEEIEKDPFSYIDDILWQRGSYSPVLIPGIETVYVGHSIVKEPARHGKITNIETGVVLKYLGKKGKLTVLEM